MSRGCRAGAARWLWVRNTCTDHTSSQSQRLQPASQKPKAGRFIHRHPQPFTVGANANPGPASKVPHVPRSPQEPFPCATSSPAPPGCRSPALERRPPGPGPFFRPWTLKGSKELLCFSPRASRPAQVIKLFLGARRESAPLRSHKPGWSWD